MRISLAAPKVGSLCRSQVGSVRAVYDIERSALKGARSVLRELGVGDSPRLPDFSSSSISPICPQDQLEIVNHNKKNLY